MVSCLVDQKKMNIKVELTFLSNELLNVRVDVHDNREP